MSTLSARIANLSPEQRELLLLRVKRQRAPGGRRMIATQPRTGQAFPLSSAQRRLWFLHQFDSDQAYHLVEYVRLGGPLNVAALADSFNMIVQRHEMLRTIFAPGTAQSDGQPVQIILPALTIELPLIELTDHAEAERDAAARQLAKNEASQPFDLERGPLLRATLVRLSPDEHRLLLTLHHSIADGWSMTILVHELMALYVSFTQAIPASLPPLPIQYVDYVIWQQEQGRGAAIERELSYWQQQLGPEGTPSLPVLELPTDRPRPAVQTSTGARHALRLPRELHAALVGLSHREGATLFMTLHAAFNVLLHRYSGQDDILIGTPIAGRTQTELEPLIGCFINTLVLRTDLSGSPTFCELLGRVRLTTQAALAHQTLPFEQLIEALHLPRDLSRSPLFQVMFVLQNTPIPTLDLPRLSLERLHAEPGSAKLDLMLELYEGPDGLSGWFEYATALFDAATIARLAQHFETLLRGIAADPHRRLHELPLLSAAEHQQIMRSWNATEQPYPPATCLHELVADQAARTPEAIAVQFAGMDGSAPTLTYHELDTRANQLAHYLRSLGVGADAAHESLVGVCMERSLELVVALLAILKAGGAYVPLDPDYPPARLQFMLHDAQVPVLIIQERLQTSLPAYPGQVLVQEQIAPQLAAQPTSAPQTTTSAANLAYMIYTSGSTGQPKGAMNTHRGIVNRLLWMQETYLLSAGDRVLQKTPYSFDVSVWEFFWPLIVGARLVVAQPAGHGDSVYLAETIQRHQVSVIHFVPSMLNAFLEEPSVAKCVSLRHVICSGEALPASLQERCGQSLPAALHNLYGPTEAAVDVTFWACTRSGDSSVPIGRPVANTQIYILDPQMQPVPVGVSGELYIGGVQVARGYHRRPGLTAEKFVPNPFVQAHLAQPDASSSRLYKTGDLARWRSDGAIEFLGRIDHQIKLRGFRIELGEIEAALAQHAAIREVAVLLREDQPGQAQLVAYLVTAPDVTLEADHLRRELRQHLPEYMIPAAFVTLAALPLTSNGKLDRRSLPQPQTSRAALSTAYAPPQTTLEQTIAAIWQEVLPIDQIGIHDSFFDLGGHSLLMLEVHTKLRPLVNRELRVVELFQYPTISTLAKYLSQESGEQRVVQQSQDRGQARRESLRQGRPGRRINV